jgi:hypothetical protein
VTTAWKPEPAGTKAELCDIVYSLDPGSPLAQWLDRDTPPSPGFKLATRLESIAVTLLIELHYYDKRGVAAERGRYERIARAARQLQRDLAGVAARGMLLNPLGRVWAVQESQETSSRDDVVSLPKGIIPSNFNIAYALCSRWGKDAHPLFLVNQAAEKVAASLPGGRGKATLNARLHGLPIASLALACAVLLQDIPKISVKRGQLPRLMRRLWKYAVGTNAPASVPYHAKTAAGKLRKKTRA